MPSRRPPSRFPRPARRLAVEALEDRTLPVVGLFDAPLAYAVGGGPSVAVAADFNNDGKADVAVLNATDQTISVLLNDGSGDLLQAGSISAQPGTAAPVALAAADANRDGNLDLLVAHADGEVDVLTGTGGGNFNAASKVTDAGFTGITSLTGMAVGDINGSVIPASR